MLRCWNFLCVLTRFAFVITTTYYFLIPPLRLDLYKTWKKKSCEVRLYTNFDLCCFRSSFSLTTHIFFSMIYGYSNTYIMRIIKLFCHVKFLCKAIKYKNDNVNINETRLVCVYFIGGGFNNCNIPSDKFLYKCLHSSYQLTWSWIEQYERKKELVVVFFKSRIKEVF